MGGARTCIVLIRTLHFTLKFANYKLIKFAPRAHILSSKEISAMRLNFLPKLLARVTKSLPWSSTVNSQLALIFLAPVLLTYQ
jgi:hypothetical protein